MSLLGSSQSSDFGNIEQRRREQVKIRKIWKYTALAVYGLITFGILSLMTKNNIYSWGIEEYKNFFFIDYRGLKNSSIHLWMYAILAGSVLVLYWSIFVASSLVELNIKKDELLERRKKVGFLLSARILLGKLLTTPTYYIFFPVSYIFLAVASDDKEDRKSFFIRHGWISHLRKNFFMQEPIITDTYTRTKKLMLFKDYPLLYSPETSIEGAKKDVRYSSLVSLFKSHEKLEDMFLISEGYIEAGGGTYDTFLSKSDFETMLRKKFNGKLDNFRLYNGRDEIFFSFDLIVRLIDEETIRFNKYISEYAIEDPYLDFSRMFKEPFETLKGDPKLLLMLRQLKTPAQILEGEEMSAAELIKRIQYVFEIYFRQIATYHIINQYINLPAGTVVVRMDDYSIRMITEIYDETSFVSIIPGKNDGSTDIFNGDSLANLFLISWNYYNYTVDNSFLDRVGNIFNFKDEKVAEDMEKNALAENDKQAKEFGDILAQDVGDVQEENRDSQ